MIYEGLKHSGQCHCFLQFLLFVYASPDCPAMKAAASGHDGSLQGRPKNLKYKI